MSQLKAEFPRRLLMAAVTTLAMSGAAYAGANAMGGDSGHGSPMGSHEHHRGSHCGDQKMAHRMGMHRQDQRVDGRMTFLKAELKITAEQEPRWDAVEAVLREGIAARTAMRAQRMQEKSDQARPSAPERLARHIERMQSRLEHMRKMADAMGELYAVLSPEQRQDADELLASFGPRGNRMARR